ncbi:MAG: hypothetical protein JNL98_17600 [Bryobacterales bacterium]|nr:hypothetical protein [Bryobacterales bacterium]
MIESAGEGLITIRQRGASHSVVRAEVREARVRTGRPRLLKTGIGAAMGAGTAFGLFTIAVFATRCSFDGDDVPEIVAGATIWGGAIGAASWRAAPRGLVDRLPARARAGGLAISAHQAGG